MHELAHLPQPFTTAEAERTGVSRYVLARLVRDHAVERIAHGLYADSARWASWWPSERATAAAAAAARVVAGAVASHCSASLLRSLPSAGLPIFPVHVTVSDLRTTPDTAWYRIHHGWLPPEHVEVVDGVAVTSAARTVVDAIRQVKASKGLAIADVAVARGMTTPEELLRVRHTQTRWPHVTRVDAVLPLLDPRRESWLESVSAMNFDLDGIPPSIPQVEILTPTGEFIGRVDDYWPCGVAGEADGRGKLLFDDGGRPLPQEEVDRRLRRAQERAEQIREQGVQLFRWTTDEAQQPGVLASRWHSAAARAAQASAYPHVRCSCCHRDLAECEVSARLAAFRARLAA